MTMNSPENDPKYRVGGDQYKPEYDRSSASITDPQTVAKFHEKADTNASAQALHHTLGTKHDEAASGDHDHNGANSKKIMTGVTITGAKGGNVALTNLLTALAANLGLTDSTT